MRPRAVDLFCKAGGAGMGLYRAGFDVLGIDIYPQPRYPFAFVQGDALKPPVRLRDFDFVWASPPCQAHTLSNNRDRRGLHSDLIPPIRRMLAGCGAGWCIENVPHAPIRADLVLDGTMFPDLRVIRRRHFELSFRPPLRLGFDATNHIGRYGWQTATDGTLSSHSRSSRRRWGLPTTDSLETIRRSMGITWPMTRAEVGNAIPPAYSEFIGRAFLAQRERAAA